MLVPEGPAGQPPRAPAGGRSGKWADGDTGTEEKRRGSRAGRPDSGAVVYRDGADEPKQSEQEEGLVWRLEDNRWRESVLEETSRWPCPRSSRTGMSGAEERSGLEALKSHQHLDRTGSVGGMRSCWECVVVWEEGQARPPTCKRAAQPPRPDLHSARPGLRHESPGGPFAAETPRAPADPTGRGGGLARGLPRAHSLVGDGRDVLRQLPRDALQNGVPEARLAQHVAPAAIDHHHLEAVLCAGVLHPIHLQAQSNTVVTWGPEGGKALGSAALWLRCGP